MRYITDKHAEGLTALQGKTDAERAQVLADAEQVHRYVRRNEGIQDADLRQYGERNGLPPDRLNDALTFLRETGQLHALELPAPLVG